MQKKIKSFDGVRINYRIKRISSFFLVFIHGAGGDLNAWKKQRQFFHKKGFSTLVVDLRGHGLSDRPGSAEDYKLEKFAKDIHHIIIKEGITQFVIIGHCFGGMVAIAFHKLFPKLSRAYILIGTAYKAPRSLAIFRHNMFFVNILNRVVNRSIRKMRFSHVNFDKFAGSGDWNLKRIYSDIRHTTLKSWLLTYQTIAKFDGLEILKRMNKPVLIIEGAKDRIFPPKIANKMHKIVRTSKLDIIPNANHILVLNNAKDLQHKILLYTKAIRKF
jgi:pimeloyl-ACP methyl ester carboxylesterase